MQCNSLGTNGKLKTNWDPKHLIHKLITELSDIYLNITTSFAAGTLEITDIDLKASWRACSFWHCCGEVAKFRSPECKVTQSNAEGWKVHATNGDKNEVLFLTRGSWTALPFPPPCGFAVSSGQWRFYQVWSKLETPLAVGWRLHLNSASREDKKGRGCMLWTWKLFLGVQTRELTAISKCFCDYLVFMWEGRVCQHIVCFYCLDFCFWKADPVNFNDTLYSNLAC